MNLVDSSGWLEYFADSKNADFFSDAIETQEDLIVSTINIYEVFKKVLRERGENAALQVIAVMQQGTIKEGELNTSIFAAKLSRDFHLPMTDSLILATAKLNNATLWTQDSDFRAIPEVRYIEKK